jgi:hypothetical protein
VVTTVAHHYHIGRVHPDGDAIMAIAVENRRDDALAQASGAVTGYQGVFMDGHAGSRDCIEIDGAHLKDGR